MCVVGNGMGFYFFSCILHILSILKALPYFQTYFINRDNLMKTELASTPSVLPLLANF